MARFLRGGGGWGRKRSGNLGSHGKGRRLTSDLHVLIINLP